MLTTLVFVALVAQEATVTFTHRCARAEIVVAALGEELGRKMKVSGSVKDDYFLVRFEDTPVQTVMDRIAKTLNATWTKSGDVEYLTRTVGQTRAEEKEELSAVREAIRQYAEKNRVPVLPGRDELERLLKIAADARKTRNFTPEARKAFALHPDRIYRNLFFQMLDKETMASLPQDGFYFMSLRPHRGLVTMPEDALKRITEIEEYRVMHEEVSVIVDLQSGIETSGQGPNRNMLSAEELLFGVVRDQFTLEVITYRSEGVSAFISSSGLVDLLGTGDATQKPPNAKGVFEMPFDRNVAEVFARPRSARPTPETSDAVFEAFKRSSEDDPLSWLASEPILQAAEREGWDVVAVLPDMMGWGAYWLPSAAGHSLSTVLEMQLTGWSEIEFDGSYLSVKPRMAGLMRRSRIDRKQVVKTAEALRNHERVIEETAEFYEWPVQSEIRSDLLRLIGASVPRLRTNVLDQEYYGDALMLLGSMSDAEQKRARAKSGYTFTASRASASLKKGLQRLTGRIATKRVSSAWIDGTLVPDNGLAIVEFLVSDPAQTKITCQINDTPLGSVVVFTFTFPSGKLLQLRTEIQFLDEGN